MPKLTGGLHVGIDNCVHTTFTHNPSTFRLASEQPNLQNIPREGPARKMFVAPRGSTFWSVDYAGIEAILVGYFAGSARYMRLAKLDIHSFFLAHTLYEFDKVLTAADLPSVSSDDGRLMDVLAGLKRQFKVQRQAVKPLVHGSNYMMGLFEAQETILKDQHKVVPIRDIRRLQGFYHELFPEIGQWHQRVTGLKVFPNSPEQENAAKGYLRSPFGNIHRYYDVLTHKKGPKGWELCYSSDAKRAVAFLPQSCGRVILTRAAQRLPVDVQATLRLFLHDELLGLTTLDHVERCLQVAKEEMERPVPELQGLVLPTEAKVGGCWGEMQ